MTLSYYRLVRIAYYNVCFEWDEISSLFWNPSPPKKKQNKNKIGNNNNNQMNSFMSNQKSCFFVELYLLDFNTNLFFFFILSKPCIMKLSLLTLSCTLHLKVKDLEAALWRFSEEKVFWKNVANLQENIHPKCNFSELICNFFKITLRHGCSPVNLLSIFRIPIRKSTYEGLLPSTTERTNISMKLRSLHFVWTLKIGRNYRSVKLKTKVVLAVNDGLMHFKI